MDRGALLVLEGSRNAHSCLYLCVYKSCWVFMGTVESSTLSTAGCVAKTKSVCACVSVSVVSRIDTQLQG